MLAIILFVTIIPNWKELVSDYSILFFVAPVIVVIYGVIRTLNTKR